MSYLAGIISYEGHWQSQPQWARERLHGAAQSLTRRGPGGGFYLDDRAAICGIAAEDPAHALALDAALYNTTAEALLGDLTRQSSAALEGLNAAFALAFWDGSRLLLARDRIGSRPLFYAEEGGLFYFGSEPKALFAMGLRPAIDEQSLRELFALGPARIPGSGVFKGMQELQPGECLIYSPSGLVQRSFWRPESRPHTDDHDTTVATVRALVEDSVALQMRGSQPCSFLSGGLDSSLVSAIGAARMRESGQRLTTYSFDFEGNDEFYQANAFQPGRDAPFAREMAAYLDTEHIELSCSSDTLADLLDDAMRARDLPGMADVDASLLYFCGIVGQRFGSALTGECSDESLHT